MHEKNSFPEEKKIQRNDGLCESLLISRKIVYVYITRCAIFIPCEKYGCYKKKKKKKLITRLSHGLRIASCK